MLVLGVGTVWGSAFYDKYLSRIDKFFNRFFKLPYTKECFSVLNILSEKDRQLWDRVLRNGGHSFIIPRIRTEHFKSIFINRNLFNFT